MATKTKLIKNIPALAELPDKRARFVLEYLKDFNGTQAALRAGYAKGSARQQASDLLSNPAVRGAIADLAYEAAKATEVDGKRILSELAGIAFNPIGDKTSAADKTRALNLLGVHHKLWEGSSGNRTINILMNQLDMRTM